MRRLFLFLLLAGCHSEAFTTPDNGTNRPFDPGPPARITVDGGDDRQISFMPGGKYLVYTQAGAFTGLGCFGFLRAGQARDSALVCVPRSGDTTTAYGHPAVSSDRRLAFEMARALDFAFGYFYQAILVAPLADLRDTTEITPVPFRSTDGVLHQDITTLAWLKGGDLAILADNLVYRTTPGDMVRPRVYTTLALPGPVHFIQPSPDGSILYFQLSGDARIQAYNVASGLVSVAYDGNGIDAGPFALGNRDLVALGGGMLVRVDLQRGTIRTSPTYDLIISEIAVTPTGGDVIVAAVDTTGPTTMDLFRFNNW